ncbi:MAG: hypothetical protein QOI80_2562 [Solirubrobacteraceae bacterium]|nr:hypothetical protein [Solirubrobacteraceae bacterium]
MPTARAPLRLALALVAALALPAGASAKVLVTYTRSGGIAGEMTSLVVERDRDASVQDRRQGPDHFRVSKKRYRALRKALRAAHFATLDPTYGPEQGVVNDGIDETVRFNGHSVTVSTGGDPPARLEKALEKLRALTARSDG